MKLFRGSVVDGARVMNESEVQQLLSRLHISPTKESFQVFFSAHDRGDGKVDVRRFLHRLLPQKSLPRQRVSPRQSAHSKQGSKAGKKILSIATETHELVAHNGPEHHGGPDESQRKTNSGNKISDLTAPTAMRGLRIQLPDSIDNSAQSRSAIDRLMLSPRSGVVYTGQPRSQSLDPHSEFLRQKYSISQKATSTNNQLYGAFFKPYSKLRRSMRDIEKKYSGDTSPATPLPPRESQSSARSPRIIAVRDKASVSLKQVLANTFH